MSKKDPIFLRYFDWESLWCGTWSARTVLDLSVDEAMQLECQSGIRWNQQNNAQWIASRPFHPAAAAILSIFDKVATVLQHATALSSWKEGSIFELLTYSILIHGTDKSSCGAGRREQIQSTRLKLLVCLLIQICGSSFNSGLHLYQYSLNFPSGLQKRS